MIFSQNIHHPILYHHFTFNGIIDSLSTNTQTLIAVDSTDVELKAMYTIVKKVNSLQHIITISSIHVLVKQPTVIYANSQAVINIIEQDRISNLS